MSRHRLHLAGLVLSVITAALPAFAKEEAQPDGSAIRVLQLPWSEPSGPGFNFGLTVGEWGNQSATEIRAAFPFSEGGGLGLQLRLIGLIETGVSEGGRMGVVPRVDLLYRSPVLLNVLRAYVQTGIQAVFVPEGDQLGSPGLGWGGDIGMEFFVNQRLSLTMEVGTQFGGRGGFAEGATVQGGLRFYPF